MKAAAEPRWRVLDTAQGPGRDLGWAVAWVTGPMGTRGHRRVQGTQRYRKPPFSQVKGISDETKLHMTLRISHWWNRRVLGYKHLIYSSAWKAGQSLIAAPNAT